MLFRSSSDGGAGFFQFLRASFVDYGSTNGTALNGVRMLPHHRYVMREGDSGPPASGGGVGATRGALIACLTLNPESAEPEQVLLYSQAIHAASLSCHRREAGQRHVYSKWGGAPPEMEPSFGPAPVAPGGVRNFKRMPGGDEGSSL